MAILASGSKVTIRNIQMEDIDQFVQWWNNGDLMASVGFRKGLGITKEQLEPKFTKQIAEKNPLKCDNRLYMILDLETKKAIGELAYGQLDIEKGSCRIGMKICELSYQGHGYGEDALITFINYLYKELGLEKIEIDTLADNLRALSLYEKVGFVRTSEVKNYWTDPDGISHDVVFLELNKEDWHLY